MEFGRRTRGQTESTLGTGNLGTWETWGRETWGRETWGQTERSPSFLRPTSEVGGLGRGYGFPIWESAPRSDHFPLEPAHHFG
jgi:hypothetical protein